MVVFSPVLLALGSVSGVVAALLAVGFGGAFTLWAALELRKAEGLTWNHGARHAFIPALYIAGSVATFAGLGMALLAFFLDSLVAPILPWCFVIGFLAQVLGIGTGTALAKQVGTEAGSTLVRVIAQGAGLAGIVAAFLLMANMALSQTSWLGQSGRLALGLATIGVVLVWVFGSRDAMSRAAVLLDQGALQHDPEVSEIAHDDSGPRHHDARGSGEHGNLAVGAGPSAAATSGGQDDQPIELAPEGEPLPIEHIPRSIDPPKPAPPAPTDEPGVY